MSVALALSAPAHAGEGDGAGSPNISSGDVIVSDVSAFADGNGGLIRVLTGNGRRDTISENSAPTGDPEFDNAYLLAIEAKGDVLVAGRFNMAGIQFQGVIRVDPKTGVRETVSLTSPGASFPPTGPAFGFPIGIAVEPSGQIIVVDSGLQAIVRVDPNTGARTILSDASTPGPGVGGLMFDGPVDAVVESSTGDILVSNSNGLATANGQGFINRVDPTTGYRDFVSSNGLAPAGSYFNSPWGVGVDKNGDVIVANPGNPVPGPGVLIVDPTTGARSTATDDVTQPGPPNFDNPIDVVRDPANNSFYATNSAPDPGVLRVRPNIQTRRIVSSNSTPVDTPNFSNPWGVGVYPVVFTKVTLPPGTIILPRPRPTASAAGSDGRATTFEFGLRESATMSIAIARRARGRIVQGKGCRRVAAENRTGLACVRWAPVGRLSRSVGKGTSRIRFDGRLGRSYLAPGRYRALFVATNRKGVQSVPHSVEFRVKR